MGPEIGTTRVLVSIAKDGRLLNNKSKETSFAVREWLKDLKTSRYELIFLNFSLFPVPSHKEKEKIHFIVFKVYVLVNNL